MNAVAPTMLSSSNVPQPELACWWPSRPSASSSAAYSAEVLAVHDQVLPVHVDLDVVDPLGAQLVDDVQRHPDVAHVDLHRGLGVLVLEEQLAPVALEHRGGLPHAVDEPCPRLAVGRLERVVVALDPGPDDEVRADLAGELGALEGEAQRLGARSPGRARRARPCRSAGRGAARPPRSRCRGPRARRGPRRGCPARARPGSGTRSRRPGPRGPPPPGAPSRRSSRSRARAGSRRARSGSPSGRGPRCRG